MTTSTQCWPHAIDIIVGTRYESCLISLHFWYIYGQHDLKLDNYLSQNSPKKGYFFTEYLWLVHGLLHAKAKDWQNSSTGLTERGVELREAGNVGVPGRLSFCFSREASTSLLRLFCLGSITFTSVWSRLGRMILQDNRGVATRTPKARYQPTETKEMDSTASSFRKSAEASTPTDILPRNFIQFPQRSRDYCYCT